MAVPRGNTPRITIRVQGAAAVQRKLKDAERRIDAAQGQGMPAGYERSTMRPRLRAPTWDGKRFTWFVIQKEWEALAKETTQVARRRAALIIQEILRQLSPKLTGRLSRRWQVAILKSGIIRLRNPQPYTNYQNVQTRNRGFIQRALARAFSNGSVTTALSGGVEPGVTTRVLGTTRGRPRTGRPAPDVVSQPRVTAVGRSRRGG